MTKQELIKQYEQAIKEAEATLDNPSAPIASQDAAEKVIESLTQKINKLTVN